MKGGKAARGPAFLLVAAALLAAGVVFLNYRSRPVLKALDPSIGDPGNVIRIVGDRFGNARGESRVEFDGMAPTSSSYVSWTDGFIEARVPITFESGLVRVVTGRGSSNPRLFMSRTRLPERIVSGPANPVGPMVSALSASSGAIGSTLSLTGLNFGANRDDSRVLFSWLADVPYAGASEPSSRGAVWPLEADNAYEAWSDKEIRVIVPDGAVSGGVQVKTSRGDSNTVYFQVSDLAGAKSYGGKRTFALSTFVTISRVKSSGPSDLYLWVPNPMDTPSQRGVKALSRSHEPFVEDHKGVTVYRLRDLAPDKVVSVTQDFLVQVYGVETDIKADRVQPPPVPDTPVYRRYTVPEPLVPSGDQRIAAFAKKAAGKERNPYRLARSVYDGLDAVVAYDAQATHETPGEAFKAGRADSYDLAIIYCAALRAAGVPAVPVAGVVVDESRRSYRHYWAEFYLYGIGWVPVDPVLGKGGAVGSFVPPFEERDRYFGNMDASHIAFSRGITDLQAITPEGKPVARQRVYFIQGMCEEGSGGLSGYTSFWSDVEVTGVY